MNKTIFRHMNKCMLMICFAIIYAFQAHAFLFHNKQQTQVPPVVSIKAKHQQEIVVLIHGLMRSSWSMRPLEADLESQGYQVYYYSYPSVKYTIHEHGIYLNQFINNLLKNNPGVKIHFITHSLGGIITREALATLLPEQIKNIGYLIMLAPPNQGSPIAKLFTKMFPMVTFSIKPLAELSSDEHSYVHRVPVPKIKIGIIAGRYDVKVPFEATRLPGQSESVVINSAHTFIMSHDRTKKLIKNFLERGTFVE